MDEVLAILRDGTVLVVTLGYAGVFLAMLVEGSGIPLPFPGPFLLAFVGYAVSTGSLDIMQATVAAAAGSTMGAWLLYRVARDAGPHLVANYGHRLALTQDKLSSAESWFRDHAGRATFFARLTPGARIYISVAAGLARMQQALFVVATFVGTCIWSACFIALGWALGEGWEKATDFLTTAQAWLFLGGVASLIALVLIGRHRDERKAKS